MSTSNPRSFLTHPLPWVLNSCFQIVSLQSAPTPHNHILSGTLKRGTERRAGWSGRRRGLQLGRGSVPTFFPEIYLPWLGSVSKTLGIFSSPSTPFLTPKLPGREKVQMAWSGSHCFNKICALGLRMSDHAHGGNGCSYLHSTLFSPKFSYLSMFLPIWMTKGRKVIMVWHLVW